jgi:hypothetical protein
VLDKKSVKRLEEFEAARLPSFQAIISEEEEPPHSLKCNMVEDVKTYVA